MQDYEFAPEAGQNIPSQVLVPFNAFRPDSQHTIQSRGWRSPVVNGRFSVTVEILYQAAGVNLAVTLAAAAINPNRDDDLRGTYTTGSTIPQGEGSALVRLENLPDGQYEYSLGGSWVIGKDCLEITYLTPKLTTSKSHLVAKIV
ncbi:hypothetical protein IAQ61_004021 [Plenodomus lingam]|uniref:uncharacterized protein n=1 Tax=Leptosphaeria maculans TaxID=5022 RepID=UPI0033200E5A|nr:hypothetical protein IAQ61_004021 [Plenodomus lingam]